jgi:hypothetical protein
MYAGLSGGAFFLVVELQTVAGYSALVAGTAMLPVTLLLLLGSSRAGALSTRIGPRWPLTGGAMCAAAGTLLMLRIGQHANYVLDVLPVALLVGVGLVLVVAPLTTAVLAAVPGELTGVASGVNNAVARAAGLLAIATLPFAVGLTGRQYADPRALDAAFHRSVWYIAGLYLLAALVSASQVQAVEPATRG